MLVLNESSLKRQNQHTNKRKKNKKKQKKKKKQYRIENSKDNVAKRIDLDEVAPYDVYRLSTYSTVLIL